MKNNIIEKLEISRQELLDIGLRGNSLLHFKPRAHSLTILDEVSTEVYSIIYEKQINYLKMKGKIKKEGEKYILKNN